MYIAELTGAKVSLFFYALMYFSYTFFNVENTSRFWHAGIIINVILIHVSFLPFSLLLADSRSAAGKYCMYSVA